MAGYKARNCRPAPDAGRAYPMSTAQGLKSGPAKASHDDKPASDLHDQVLHLVQWLLLTFAMYGLVYAITGLSLF